MKKNMCTVINRRCRVKKRTHESKGTLPDHRIMNPSDSVRALNSCEQTRNNDIDEKDESSDGI